jgi:photosynthetic reaction center cytochrome c subunit
VPANVWFSEVQPRPVAGVSGEWALQNHPKHVVGLTALPYDPFTAYLLGDENIRIAGQVDDSTGRPVSTQHAEKSYGLMIHMSNSLGVNCTFCHNTRNFSTWDGSTPQRMTAWYGIRMVRALNNDYLVPLTGTFPESRLGPGGDVAKVYCNTCHNGVSKPLYGAAMAKDYPALAAPATVDTAAAAQAKQP